VYDSFAAAVELTLMCTDFEREVGHPNAEEHAATAEEVGCAKHFEEVEQAIQDRLAELKKK
jgi:hypothetical protein